MVYRTILDLSGNIIKAEGFENEAGETIGPIEAKTEIAALVALGGTITGATANDTMTAVADIALSTSDTYTDAAVNAAVNAAVASIEDNFADLQTKVNAIIAALKA